MTRAPEEGEKHASRLEASLLALIMEREMNRQKEAERIIKCVNDGRLAVLATTISLAMCIYIEMTYGGFLPWGISGLIFGEILLCAFASLDPAYREVQSNLKLNGKRALLIQSSYDGLSKMEAADKPPKRLGV